jgi:uroporphyrinogen-III decarboxylase
MTPKERMLTALAGGKPDIMPIAPYFWGAEYRWKVVGVEIWELLYGNKEMAFIGNDKLQERHPCDWINVHGFGNGWLEDKIVEKLDDHVYMTDKNGTKYEFLKDGHQIVRADARQDHAPNTGIISKDIKTKADVDKLWGRPRQPREKTKIEIAKDNWQRQLIDKYGDTVLMVGGGISPFVQACYTLGFETSLIMMKENPDVFIYMMDRFFEDSLAHYEWVSACGYDAILIAESWASVDIISPKQYEDFAFPYQKKAIQEAQSHGLKAILYSTGYLMPILPKMRELGADALTIEEGRKGEPMDIGKVREILGPKQCIFGNFDAENVLLKGNREDIEREVKRQIDSAGRDGAFIMGTGSPVCDDTTPESIDHFIQRTRQYGVYR